jgi:parallel beta-helix repeat protein
MRKKKIGIVGLAISGVFLCLLSSVASGACHVSVTVDDTIYTYPSIQKAIESVNSPYAIIKVNGTCDENLFISEQRNYLSITGPATINGVTPPDNPINPNPPVIQTLGKGTRIFDLTINSREGQDGIQVIRGGTAFIESITLQGSGRSGIVVAMSSFAHIIGNTIQGTFADGIMVADNSTARIGVRNHDETTASPNTIQGNEYGVTVIRSSSALIVGNTISGNRYDGIRIAKVSQADISNNTINGNGRYGILATQNSGVNLGRDTGDTIFDSPNTTTVGNGVKGLSCSLGGYVDGRLGTLNGLGKHNATEFTKDCVDSLIP